jgi:hypothetical protein
VAEVVTVDEEAEAATRVVAEVATRVLEVVVAEVAAAPTSMLRTTLHSRLWVK